MIELREISKSFSGKTVLENLNLRVREGETLVLLGLSGSGKTTCLKLMNALIRPDSGHVLINGKDLSETGLLQQRRQMGYVIQQSGLFPHYTVFENVAVVPRLLGWGKEKIRDRIYTVLDKLHLNPEEFSRKYPGELSGGQQQRVGLARALAADPPILLMDEPFGALDPITRKAVQKEFLELEELKQKTIVLVTHDVQEAFELGDRIALLHQGKLVADAEPTELLHLSDHAFADDFIGTERLTLALKSSGLYNQLNMLFAEGTLREEDFKKWIP